MFSKLLLAFKISFSFFFLNIIDCGYLLEPPWQGSSNVPTINVYSKIIKNIKFFPFLQLKKLSVYCMGEFLLCERNYI